MSMRPSVTQSGSECIPAKGFIELQIAGKLHYQQISIWVLNWSDSNTVLNWLRVHMYVTPNWYKQFYGVVEALNCK